MPENPKGKKMDNPVGVYSYKDNPLPQAKRVAPMCGPGGNPDQRKANELLKRAQMKDDSLRGKSGM